MAHPPKSTTAEIFTGLDGNDHRGSMQKIVDCCRLAKDAAQRLDAHFLAYLLDMAALEAMGQVERLSVSEAPIETDVAQD